MRTMTLSGLLGTARAAMAVLTLGGLATPEALQAQTPYPNDTVTLLIAWGAGGATDVVTRAIQPALADQLGTNVIIKNVPGAAGTIGTAEAAKAKPDGYTVFFTPAGPLSVQPHLRKLPYEMASFRPVGRISLAPMLMMTTADSRFSSAQDVIDAAKADPGQVTVGTVGAGSLPHLAALAFESAAGVSLKQIPFKGSSDGMKGLLGGTVELFNDQSQLAPQYDLTPLAALSAERLSEFPDVPTMKELGHDIEMSNWLGVFVPAGTPDEIVTRLNAALNAALGHADVQAQLTKLQIAQAPTSPEDFGTFANAHSELSRTLLQQAGLVK